MCGFRCRRGLRGGLVCHHGCAEGLGHFGHAFEVGGCEGVSFEGFGRRGGSLLGGVGEVGGFGEGEGEGAWEGKEEELRFQPLPRPLRFNPFSSFFPLVSGLLFCCIEKAFGYHGMIPARGAYMENESQAEERAEV